MLYELSERDRRTITRAVLKYGDLEARYDDTITDFDLGQKNKDAILNFYHDLIQECTAKVCEQAECNNSSLKGVEVSEEILLRELRHSKQRPSYLHGMMYKMSMQVKSFKGIMI